MHRILLVGLVLVIAVSTLIGCGQQPAAPSKPSGTPATGTQSGAGATLTIAVVNDPPTFDLDRTTWVEMTQSIMYDSLVEKDFEGKIRPKLAKSWTISPDGLKMTFKLRDDVKFHCGHPFDASAVKFRIDRMQNPAKPSANIHMAANIEKVTVDDKYTVTFHMKKADAAIWDFLGTAFGAPFCPVCVQKYGEDFGQHPCGTGPFKFSQYVPGSHLTVVRNDAYKWGAEYWENRNAPYIEKINFRFIADEATRLLELEKGSIDFVAGVPPQQVKRLQQNKNVQIIQFPSNGIRYWGFNVKKWPWTDVAVRQAMQYAINKEAITKSALEGFAKPLWSSLPPSIAGYSDKMENQLKAKYPYDPQKTRKLLEANGWKAGPDGIYVKDGKPFRVSVWVVNDPVQIRVAEMIKDDLKKVGVDLKIEIMEQARLTSDTPKGLHESLLWMYGWYDPDILYHVFNKGGTRMHFQNDQLQALLEKGRAILKMEERLPIYDQAQLLLAEQCPWVVLYFPQAIQGWSSRVTNIKNNPYNGALLLNDLKLK